MSAVKFAYQPYKLFEPPFHPERPIIVDADSIDSPETVTLRYEEEAAARANGGCLRGDSPPGFLPKSYLKPQPPQMHAFESSRSYQDPQYQYSAPSFPAHQPENGAAQLNQMAFAANSSASQYMAPASVEPTLISYQPSATRVTIKITAPYDLIGVTSHFFLAFGQQRCPAHAIRDTHDTTGYGYVVSGDVPSFEDTRSPSTNVPLSLLVETHDAQPFATIAVGTFTYHDTQVGSVGTPSEDVTRKISQSPEQRQSPPKQEEHQHPPDHLSETATNTYGYHPEGQQETSSTYDAAYPNNNNNNNNMIGTYHRTYSSDYRHIPPPPKATHSSTWSQSPYGPSTSSLRSPALSHSHASITRPTITSLPAPMHNSTLLVRTSTLQSQSPNSGQYNPYQLFPQKAQLKINGDLESMANGWSKEEWENRRRIVLFTKKLQGSVVTTSFRPVSVNERPSHSICISCIWWAEKGECYVTSVDTIHLLEQLVAAPSRFTVEEKNRIRRNLEGFRPLTVSKAKADSEEFFKIIMAFPNPKPRNIEKDVKVFPWKILAQALKKIISKYSASPSTHPVGPALLTPISSTSPGLYPPPHTPNVPDNYSHHDAHSIASPRSLSGASSTWATGGYSGRSLCPDLKSTSPTVGTIRMPSLSSYGALDTRNSAHYGLPPQPQGRWDTAAVTSGYIDAAGVPAYTNHQHQSQVYGTGAYGDAGQRA
ncbi:uncharacterized protein BCR38DRAFT_504073 [Pseudomassariella vexata]|uniref:DUF7082 domain-containing protein n=1 Tax=Pseudomassariella vexata TaxID=1141098 RepID=A0A1Y2EGE4_9PEZI|nr:uncharacterized protein BCR38DRAFT_504073 [Pseudomassariella vexata]ORY70487.1 hypothetical protein BCR38DRAFT_504073 [Pseudomassariella vexata]